MLDGITCYLSNNTGITHEPVAVKPFVCKSVTDHVVNTTQQLAGCPLSISTFHTKDNFALLPISKTYQCIIGKNTMRRLKMRLDFDPEASHCLEIRGSPMAADAELAVSSLLPDWDDDADIVGNVYDMGALTTTSGHEFCVLSPSKFKKLRKKSDRMAKKRALQEASRAQKHEYASTAAHPPSILKITCLAMCLLATVGLGDSTADYTSVGALDRFENNSSGLFAQDQNASDFDVSSMACSSPEPDTETPSFLDPYLKCPRYILQQINKLRADCADVWKVFKTRTYGCFTSMPHEKDIKRKYEVPMSIELKDEFVGKSPPPPRKYRTPHHLLGVLKNSLMQMLKAGWIRASTSEYCAPVLILVKPHQDIANMNPVDVKYRICVDLSDLNRRTKTIHYRVPDVTTAWDKLSKAKYFSVIDLEKGFWQSKLCPDDGSIERTAFGCEFGHYEFVVAPMGAKNSPAHFQNGIESMTKRYGLMDTGCLRLTGPETISVIDGTPCVHTHIDDLIIYSNTKEAHLRDLHRVCTALSEENYYCNRDKCFFFCKYVKYVGGIVGNGFLAMDPDKVSAIDGWEQPTTTTEMRGFLGMCNFLRRWYQHYAEDCYPLNQLLKKNA